MIDIVAYNHHDRCYVNDLTVNDIETCLTDERLYVWVDFNKPNSDEIDLLKTLFKLDPLAIEDCTHTRQLPKLESFSDYHFFIVQGPTLNVGNLATDAVELDGFLADRYLITYHEEEIPSITEAKKKNLKSTGRLSQGVSYLAYDILDHMIDMYLPILDFLEEKNRLLTAELHNHSFNEKTTQEYMALARYILDLRRTATKNQQVFYQFSHSSLAFIDADEARLFRDIHDHMIRVMDMSDYYHHTLHETLNIQLSLSSHRMNQVVQLLTIMATIMLPLNVITGIYGMNFTWMPLLHSPYGFWSTVALMLAIIGGLLFYFRRRKWI
ncbi:MAG: magnesium/cobalt transporter CorA [Vampirovibrionales bacterium]|nr:magnesium/cobalt transporter CorA [Vampirovibrionales bacterium]